MVKARPQLLGDMRRKRRQHRNQSLEHFMGDLNVGFIRATVVLDCLVKSVYLVRQFHQRRDTGIQMQSLLEILGYRADDLMHSPAESSVVFLKIALCNRYTLRGSYPTMPLVCNSPDPLQIT